jgi:hypothetical protein
MPSPSPSTSLASLRPDFKEALTEFDLQMNESGMIGLRVMPVIEAQMQAGSFPKIKIESLLRQVATARASGGAYNFTEFDFTDDTFATKENGITVPIDRRNANIYSEFGMGLMAARLARSTVLTNMEIRIASILFNASTYTPTPETNEWDDPANATPLTGVEVAVQKLYDKGVIANALVINYKVFRNLRNCEQVIERINSQGAGSPTKAEDVTIQMLKSVFALEHILVGRAQYNSAAEGQSAVLSPIWSGEYAAVTRVANGPNDTLEQPCCGRTFHWGGDGSSIDGTIETYYDEEIRGDKVRYRMETQEKELYTDATELLSNITT